MSTLPSEETSWPHVSSVRNLLTPAALSPIEAMARDTKILVMSRRLTTEWSASTKVQSSRAHAATARHRLRGSTAPAPCPTSATTGCGPCWELLARPVQSACVRMAPVADADDEVTPTTHDCRRTAGARISRHHRKEPP